MPNSQTRKRSSARAPRDLKNWLGNPYEQLRRALSFAEGGVTDEEFFAFFDQIGEVASGALGANRSPQNRTRSHKSPARRSPRAAAGKPPSKSPKTAKSLKAAALTKAAGHPNT